MPSTELAVALESVAAGVFGLADVRTLFALDTGLTAVLLSLVGGLPPPVPVPVPVPLLLFLRSNGGMNGLEDDRPPVVSPSRISLISGGIGIWCTILIDRQSAACIIRYSLGAGARQQPGQPGLGKPGF